MRGVEVDRLSGKQGLMAAAAITAGFTLFFRHAVERMTMRTGYGGECGHGQFYVEIAKFGIPLRINMFMATAKMTVANR